jgi:hypothetical protein
VATQESPPPYYPITVMVDHEVRGLVRKMELLTPLGGSQSHDRVKRNAEFTVGSRGGPGGARVRWVGEGAE